MSVCPKCGTEDTGTPYCTGCGTRLRQGLSPSAPPPPPQVPIPPPWAQPIAGLSLRPASVFRRLWAFLFDVILFGVLSALLFKACVVAYRLGSGVSLSTETANTASAVFEAAFFLLATFAFLGTGGQTPGKNLFHILVVRTDGRPLAFSGAMVRTLGYLLSLASVVGFPLAFFDRRRQTLHDKLADTLVVNAL